MIQKSSPPPRLPIIHSHTQLFHVRPFVVCHLERIVLGRNLLDKVVAENGDLDHDVVADAGHLCEEEDGEDAGHGAEPGGCGAELGGAGGGDAVEVEGGFVSVPDVSLLCLAKVKRGGLLNAVLRVCTPVFSFQSSLS